ncbi:hypothetical protein DL93DRAFT_700862 [Clavulina sp. PMI_390]|nr:hypothetical protein DL93DRAFT_700862 [Clavulina sp. PMI_390]
MEGPSAVFSPGHPMSASPAASGSTGHFRPLPLPPSQTASPVPHQLAMLGGHSRSTSLSGRERLNPLAKPFVFGAGASAFNPVVQRPDSNASNSPRSATPSSLRPSHSRQGSMSSKLNAGAAEFKPSFLSSSAFNFRPPPGLPTMPFPQPVAVAAHSPHPQLNASVAGNSPPTRAQQGREKRQRKLSSLDLGGEGVSEKDDGDSAPLFDFPPEWSSNAEPAKIEEEEEERIPMMRRKSVLNPDAKPFTMGVAAAPAVLAQLALPTSSSAPATVPASLRSKRSGDEMNGEEDDSDEDAEHEGLVSRLASLSPESAQKGRRPPIPDFQLSAAARKKTVPASVFHALASADSETSVRPAVRSRLSARENLFAEVHSRNASLDDFNVPSIALRSSRGNKTAPLQPRQAGSPFGSVVDDVFTQSPEANQLGLPFGRQASVQRARPISSLSTNSEGDQWVKPAAELPLDEGLLDLLDDKFDSLRKDLLNRPDDLTPADVRDALMDFLPVLSGHIQTQLTAHHNLISGNDSLTDAKGEIDYEHLNSIIENGHHDLRSALQRDIAELAQALEHQASPHSVFNLIDNTHKEMVAHFHSSTKSILSHFDAIEDAARRRPAEERQKLLQELMHVLLPQLHQLRPEPFDVDTITMHLAEAVKPHISQLINLTSDKHETAGLIADQLRPQIAALQPSPFDIQAISNRLSSELQMATSGIDVHTIKEAVSDLVVERLDARLANRDNLSDHLEELAKRISTSLTPSLEHSEKLAAVQDAVSARINDILANHTSLQSEQSELSTKLSSLPESLSTASVALAEARDELKSKARDLHEMQDLQRVMEAHVSVQMELAQSKASVIELTAEKDVLTKRLAQLEAEAEARQAEVARLLARVSAQDDLVAHADDRVAGMEKSRVEAESKQQALEASLLVKDQQIESLQSDKHTLQGDSKDLQSKVWFLLYVCSRIITHNLCTARGRADSAANFPEGFSRCRASETRSRRPTRPVRRSTGALGCNAEDCRASRSHDDSSPRQGQHRCR